MGQQILMWSTDMKQYFVYHMIRWTGDVIYVGIQEGDPDEGCGTLKVEITTGLRDILQRDRDEGRPSFQVGVVAKGLTKEHAERIAASSI
jgi:hypothetical protein